MIVGVGVDLVSIPRFQRLLSLYGTRVLRRLFHPTEIQHKPIIVDKHAQYFASRWAVKEATIKALGQGGIGSKQIYVEKQQGSNVPQLVLEGEALDRLNFLANSLDHNNVKKHISISHDNEYAIAMVVLEKY
jgi:holo-[acyl-carrier protein] synthase